MFVWTKIRKTVQFDVEMEDDKLADFQKKATLNQYKWSEMYIDSASS